MSKLQAEVASHLNNIEDVLAELGDRGHKADYENITKIYNDFLLCAWHALPIRDAEGAALATVSCMPLWESLNQTTSATELLEPVRKGFAVQLLTSLYPKARDRRCVYQQLNTCGTTVQTAVPLNIHIPLESEIFIGADSSINAEYMRVVSVVSNVVKLDNLLAQFGPSFLSAATNSLIKDVLPKCVLSANKDYNTEVCENGIRIFVKERSARPTSGIIFMLTIWRYLILSEMLNLPEAKELAIFLQNSNWGMTVFEIDGRKMTYSSFVSALVDIAFLCLSTNPRTMLNTADTVPFIDPRIIFALGQVHRYEVDVKRYRDFSATETKHVMGLKKSLTKKSVDNLSETLSSTIIGEIDFTGCSSSCRDFDQLTYLCRDMLFLPLSGRKVNEGISTMMRRDALFNRKRSRRARDREGPSFLPVRSSLSDMMEKNKKESQTILERLCCHWSGKE